MDDEDFRDFQERVFAIRSLLQTPGWEYLIDRSKVTLKAKHEQVMNGNLDHNQYLKETWFARGIDFVFHLPTIVEQEFQVALAEKLEQDAINAELEEVVS